MPLSAALGFEFENLGYLDEAEALYKQMYSEYDYRSSLLHFYLNHNRDEDALNFIKEEGFQILGLGSFGRLHEWGIYDEYLAECYRQPYHGCLENLDREDITPELLERAWTHIEEEESREEEFYSKHFLQQKLDIAHFARDAEIDTDYDDFIREEMMRQIQSGAVPIVIIHDGALYDDFLEVMEARGIASDKIADFALANSDEKTAYWWYKKSDDTLQLFDAAYIAEAGEYFQDADELFSLYLERSAGDRKDLNSLWKTAHALNMTHRFDEAMQVCETSVSDLTRCDCAAEVIEHLYSHINGGSLPEWKPDYDE